MTVTGQRHFGSLNTRGNRAVIILGHRKFTNDLMVCDPEALSIEDATTLRGLASSSEAQNLDYLISLLGKKYHPSGDTWAHFLIKAISTGRITRIVPMKDVTFSDQAQKAFYGGFGPSAEPDEDARRTARVEAQEAILSGSELPEPSEEQINAILAKREQAIVAAKADQEVVTPARAEPSSDPALAAIAQALGALAEGQAAMAEAIGDLKKNTPRKPGRKPGRKPSTTRAKTKAKAAEKEETSMPEETSTPSGPDADEALESLSYYDGTE